MKAFRWLVGLFWGPAPGTGWVLLAGLASGFIVGVAATGMNEVHRYIEVLTFTTAKLPGLPEPVTPPPPGRHWVQVLTTGYCPCEKCCPGTSDGKTANNRDVIAYPFGYATDLKLLPFRTTLEIPGYGYAEVDDTGGAMRQDAKKGVVHIDLRFRDHQQARKWGRQLFWIAVPEESGAAHMPQPAAKD